MKLLKHFCDNHGLTEWSIRRTCVLWCDMSGAKFWLNILLEKINKNVHLPKSFPSWDVSHLSLLSNAFPISKILPNSYPCPPHHLFIELLKNSCYKNRRKFQENHLKLTTVNLNLNLLHRCCLLFRFATKVCE